MFDLEKAIVAWRLQLQSGIGLTRSDADELESHLRDGIDELAPLPLSVEESFLVASCRLGGAGSLALEFSKNNKQRRVDNSLSQSRFGLDDSAGEYVYAGFSRRLMACMFDLCVYVLVCLMLIPVFSLPLAWAVLLITLLKVVFAGYVVGSTYCYGGTIGKFIAGIRISRIDGSALSLKQSVLRSIPYLFFMLLELVIYTQTLILDNTLTREISIIGPRFSISALVVCAVWLVASAILLIRNEHSRTIHDHLADTIVVDEHYARTNITRTFA